MPQEPEWLKQIEGVDLGDPSGRFNRRPAVAINLLPEAEPTPPPRDALEDAGLNCSTTIPISGRRGP